MLVPIQLSVQQPIARALLPDLADTSLHGAWLNWQTAQDNLGTDYSADGDDMTPVGAPTSERVGARFDGAADYLRRAEADWRSGDSLGTIAAWIKLNSVGVFQSIFCSSDETATLNYLSVQINNTDRLRILNSGSEGFNWVQGDTVFVPDVWYHVAVVSDDSSWAIYVNGVAETISIGTGANIGSWLDVVLSRDNVVIGLTRRSDLWGYFDGEIRDVRYHSEAKSADWIKHDFQRGVPDDTLLLHLLDGSYDLSRYERALVRSGGVVTGHDMEFDGVDDVIDCGDLGNIQTIMGWVKPETTTEEIWLVDAGNDVMVSGGTVTYAGLTPVATYVNGVAGTTMVAGVWQHLACVVATVDANNFELGTDGANFGATSQRDVKVFSAAKAADFIRAYYLKTRGFY